MRKDRNCSEDMYEHGIYGDSYFQMKRGVVLEMIRAGYSLKDVGHVCVALALMDNLGRLSASRKRIQAVLGTSEKWIFDLVRRMKELGIVLRNPTSKVGMEFLVNPFVGSNSGRVRIAMNRKKWAEVMADIVDGGIFVDEHFGVGLEVPVPVPFGPRMSDLVEIQKEKRNAKPKSANPKSWGRFKERPEWADPRGPGSDEPVDDGDLRGMAGDEGPLPAPSDEPPLQVKLGAKRGVVRGRKVEAE